MSLDTQTKQSIIAEYGTKPGDTGSPEVQIALLSRRIEKAGSLWLALKDGIAGRFGNRHDHFIAQS